MTLFDSGAVAPHPARFTSAHLEVLVDALRGFDWVLDPFAGVGTIHRLRRFGHHTIGVELEPEWARQHPGTLLGDARHLQFADGSFDAVATSPTFGNRMADHHNARDASVRHTYRHYLGRSLSAGSSAAMQWGPAYREFHEQAWTEATRIIRPRGRFVLNIKDHIRDGRVAQVTQWHYVCLARLGWQAVMRWEFEAQGMAHGENHDRRVRSEYIIAFERNA
jgi:tRNA G10  N-methylase Trm11